ncbi:hypothetical protein J14TS2_17190 [Bacillus sp. J14TS2]|uniref:phage tail family protein n=1 Tax=Bacillus sp. J14TS2 TaxID=2807188 RepID=UPI001B23BDE7|nr:phage tail family protein [Bacillus sp. J14TS2]GIN71244.1 hypothetical protein J14TS2_17190 [Bacillus sp. J14TS2]
MVYINDVSVEKYDLSVADRPPIPTAEQDVEYKEIKGRHGSLTKKYGFKDIPYPITFNFLEDTSFKPAFRKAKMMFFYGKKLSFSDDPGIYYKIKSLSIEEAENVILEYGKFTVNFVLAPFEFEEESQPITITAQTVLNNEGYESEPYIKAYVEGTGKFYINDQVVTIQNINGTIEIDSEMKNAYRKADGYITNLNNHMIGDFPVLDHGENVIKFDGDITKLEINPRWRWV